MNEPTITRRALVKYTQKEGWTVSEVSVTISNDEADRAPEDMIDLAPYIVQTYREAREGLNQIDQITQS